LRNIFEALFCNNLKTF